MSWKSTCFGCEHPSVLRVVVVGVLMLGLGLCLYGMVHADFIPSDTWHSIGYYASVGLATVLTLGLYWTHYTGQLESPERRRWVRVLSFMAVPFLFFGYCYLCLMYALPDLGTRWLGENAVRMENVITLYREGRGHTYGAKLNRRYCRYYIKGPGLDRALFSRICSATQIPGNSVSPTALDLAGSESWFGFHVSGFTRHPVEQEDHAIPAIAEPGEAPGRVDEALASVPTRKIEAEQTGSSSYRLHLTGAVFKGAEAGRALLRPKAAELCGNETFRFGESHYSWQQRMARGGDRGTPVVELTQDVHCGNALVPDGQNRPDNE